MRHWPAKMDFFDPMDHDTPGIDLLAVGRLAFDASKECHRYNGHADAAVEVGSWAGLTALAITPHFPTLYCVDHWLGSGSDDRITELAARWGKGHACSTFCANMGERLLRHVQPCIGSSAMWASIFAMSEVRPSFVFLDADHSYSAVSQDIKAWWPLVAKSGTLCGHDYGSFPGVQRAVDEAFGDRVKVMPGGRVWYVNKDKAEDNGP